MGYHTSVTRVNWILSFCPEMELTNALKGAWSSLCSPKARKSKCDREYVKDKTVSLPKETMVWRYD